MFILIDLPIHTSQNDPALIAMLLACICDGLSDPEPTTGAALRELCAALVRRGEWVRG